MSKEAWTIPFNGTNYVCWTDRKGRRQSRKMTPEEERAYFTAQDRDGYLNELLNK